MIELITEKTKEPISIMFWYERQGWHINGKFYKKAFLSDALWEACKEVLNG